MSRQLAVINPQFGDLSPTGDSRRSVQRALGKADRRLLTGAIQQFAAYVDPAGETSTRPGMAYRNMTAMVYRPAGLNALQRKAKAAGQNARDLAATQHLLRAHLVAAHLPDEGIVLAVGDRLALAGHGGEADDRALAGLAVDLGQHDVRRVLGDPITARFMRQDFFTYTPQFKLLIAGNHKPGLRNIDEAIRRRFHLLPFTVRIPPEARDPNLFDKLKEEWPAILGWALQGCLEWQAEGLNPPAAVIEATAEYFDDEDSFGRWLAECCVRDPMAHETTRDLYAGWTAWAERSGMSAGSEPKFRGALKARGLESKRLPGLNVSGFLGIRLNRKDYTDDLRYGG